MELHALDRQRLVPHGHDLAVLGPRRDLELFGNRGRGQGVVPPDLELLRQPLEYAASVVLDDARFSMQEPPRAADLPAERLDDRLVPETDAERRHTRVADEPDELLGRTARAGGEDEVRRLEPRVQLVRPAHRDLRAELAQVVREVVRERVVVVDKQYHDASARSIAASSAASLRRHSSCSAVGSESATIPAPACSRASPSSSTIVLIAMHVSSEPSGSA